ncbi:MAG: hypothetical protein V1769_02515 [Thermoplasmatota archaeon]
MNIKKHDIIRTSSLRKNEQGVVGIVVTVLLIGLILAVTVMIQTAYIPQWLEESEATHMDEVSNEFTRLKYALDIQSLVNDSTSVSTFISLGIKEIPVFNTGRTFDDLRIIDDAFYMTIERNGTAEVKEFSSDSIVFTSKNSYFVNQKYIYEGGALILQQDPTNILYGNPNIKVTEYNFSLSLVLVNISVVSGSDAVSGYGNYPIYTEVQSNEFYNYSWCWDLFENVTNITIFSSYPHAWYTAFNSSLRNMWNNYTIDEQSDRVVIRFRESPTSDRYIPNLFKVHEVKVNTKISFGLTQ